MIAACDTFRSGAVEQLKTHCARLGVPLYERGYEKDPAKVAFEAQRAAARASTDVLLVDTAGVGPQRGLQHYRVAVWSLIIGSNTAACDFKLQITTIACRKCHARRCEGQGACGT